MALEVLVARPEMRRAMGEQGYQRAKAHYDWPVVIAAYQGAVGRVGQGSRAWSAAGATLQLENFGYREIFSHYPTDYLTEETPLRLTAVGQTWNHDLEWLSKSANLKSVFRAEVFESILDRLKIGGSMDVATLLSQLDTANDTESTLNMAHLCRLIKYGLIESQPLTALDPAVDDVERIASLLTYNPTMKLRIICKSKIHHAVVTGADLELHRQHRHRLPICSRLTDIVTGEQVCGVEHQQRPAHRDLCDPAAGGDGAGDPEWRGGASFPGRRSDHRRRVLPDGRDHQAPDDHRGSAEPIPQKSE